jgi:hypothetical protein
MKDITECHARLRGIFNITVTPFTADGAFHHAGLARNIERVIGLGFDGILIGGTYGEFPAMSVDEPVPQCRRRRRRIRGQSRRQTAAVCDGSQSG